MPSFVLKADRAEQHLHQLKRAIRGWADSHPYEVAAGFQNNPRSHHLHFTASPPTDLPLMVGDFVYNLRSGLDHLMGALVPAAQRSSVYFPIYFQGVWNPALPGEGKDAQKARCRWRSDTAKVHPQALAILQGLQPPQDAGQRGEGVHALLLLNKIAVADRHRRLAATFVGLRGFRLLWEDAQGNHHIEPLDTGNPGDERKMLEAGAELGYPPGVTNMQVGGSPVVVLQIPEPPRVVEIPEALDRMLDAYRNRVVDPLAPYVRKSGGKRV